MKRLFTLLGVAVVLVWFTLLFLLLFISGLRPFDTAIPTSTQNTVQRGERGLFQGWYHAGSCIYIEQDTGCDIDG